ncbi:hypothetical protein WCQ02_33465 [Paraburkholderia tropica]|uniref:hypothetical protein n=1 Tax=Paraburkholderia tropica TaxID=92647 RepID=UPI0030174598
MARTLALCVGVTATGTSIAITVLAGLERGASASERLILVAVGLSFLLGAHLTPAIAREAKTGVKVLAFPVWLAALLSTSYTHSTFFLTAQQHSGDLRANAVSVPVLASDELAASRDTSGLLRDKAKIEEAIAQSMQRKCADDCRALMTRRQTLRIRLDALNGQIEQAHRVERADDRRVAEREGALARREALRGDLVSTTISTWLGVPAAALNLWLGIFFGMLVEILASFCWYVASSNSRGVPVAEPKSSREEGLCSGPPIAGQHPRPSLTLNMLCPAANDPSTSAGFEVMENIEAQTNRAPDAWSRMDEEARLRAALRTGMATSSISEIVRLLGCTEGRALALRRQIAATSPQLLVASG